MQSKGELAFKLFVVVCFFNTKANYLARVPKFLPIARPQFNVMLMFWCPFAAGVCFPEVPRCWRATLSDSHRFLLAEALLQNLFWVTAQLNQRCPVLTFWSPSHLSSPTGQLPFFLPPCCLALQLSQEKKILSQTLLWFLCFSLFTSYFTSFSSTYHSLNT